jgi:Na+-driven multidrug efflux pump
VRPVLRLVLPVLLEQFLGLTVGFTDKWLAGNLFSGEEPLAAVGLVAYCLAFLPVTFALPAVAATALVARAVGSGDRAAARRAAAQALLVGAAISAAALVVIWLGGRPLLGCLGLPEGSTALAGRYLAIVLPVLPAMMLIHVGMAVLRGAGDMVAGLLGMTVVNLVNAGASFALAVGAFGSAGKGSRGARRRAMSPGQCASRLCLPGRELASLPGPPIGCQTPSGCGGSFASACPPAATPWPTRPVI